MASHTDRRGFLRGLAALPFATMWPTGAPARAQTNTLEDVEIPIEGSDPVGGVLARPEAENAPALLLIHEWWGLNEQIREAAAEYARLGFLAFAIDLFGPEPTSNPEAALEMVQGLDPEIALARLLAGVEWLKAHENGNGRIGTIGWGFGGGWSLDASLATPVDATVIYYGNVNKSAAELQPLASAVIAHFGTLDETIPEAMIERFQRSMEEAGKADALAVYWYEADHAFANPSDPRYDADDARLARDRTLEFLRARLG